jgi:VanZ family protein
MFKLVRKISRNIWLALIWSILTQVLLSLPGSVFPSKGLFSIPHLDKIAHIGLFGGLVFFWSLFIYFKKPDPAIGSGTLWAIVFFAIAYGIIMEFIQENFIPNRSFDRGDIVADIVGSLIGYILTQGFLRWYARDEHYKIN